VHRLGLLMGLLALLVSPLGLADGAHALVHALAHGHHEASPTPLSLDCSSDCGDTTHHHHQDEHRSSRCVVCASTVSALAAALTPPASPLIAVDGLRLDAPSDWRVSVAPRPGSHRERAPPLPEIAPAT
jgi:hypothetical protein